MVTSGTEPDSGTDVPAVPAATPQRLAAEALLGVCPYLRVEGGSWRSAHASRDHQCGAMFPAAQVSIAKQRALCLRPAHTTCATFLAADEARGTVDRPGDDTADLWPTTRSTPVVLEANRGLLGPLVGRRSWTGGQALLAGLMVVAFLVLVVARASGPGSGGKAGPITSPSPTASTASSAAPTPSLAASPSSGATAQVTPQPSPTVTAAPAASPTAIAGRTYTVKSGDTLSAIAAKFATTVAALTAANNISDPRVIRVGQVLVIP